MNYAIVFIKIISTKIMIISTQIASLMSVRHWTLYNQVGRWPLSHKNSISLSMPTNFSCSVGPYLNRAE